MKIIIRDELVNNLREQIKRLGVSEVVKLVGGVDIFCKVLNIDGFMDFLHLFDNLEQVQSEEKEYFTLFRYKKGNNLMIYDRKSKEVYIDYDEIWSFLEDKFDLTFSVAQGVIKKWLDEVYNLSEITPQRCAKCYRKWLD